MADALDCTIGDLAPELHASTKNRMQSQSSCEITKRADGLWYVRIDQVVDHKTMLKIVSIMEDHG